MTSRMIPVIRMTIPTIVIRNNIITRNIDIKAIKNYLYPINLIHLKGLPK
ncbi:MAG: hypothetical protein K6E72_04185 [Saccharofermentans sp.]|nr:hypothetical protein [Saccharofermentans sp.]